MIFKGLWTVFLCFMLWSCGFEYSSGTDSPYYAKHCSANADMPLGRSPICWTFAERENAMYILDDFSGISRWILHHNDCNWELDRSFGDEGLKSLDGFVDEIHWHQGQVWMRNGSVVENQEKTVYCMGSSTESFGVWASKLVMSASVGAQVFDVSGGRCNNDGFVGNVQTQAVGVNDHSILLAEKPLIDGTMSFWSYDWQGSLKWFYMQEAQGALCGVDKIAMGREVALLLDLKCHQVGVLGYHGDMLGVLSLRDHGVPRRIKDIAAGELGEFWLLSTGQPLTYKLSYRYLMGNI
ncbi:MAG: hypothetical protein GX801_07920 [Fibrobacter sp.]|nr:hypothetical protein [Fibrobacter sp.]